MADRQFPVVFKKEVVGRFEVSTIIHDGGRGHAESMLFPADESVEELGGPFPYKSGADAATVHAEMVERARQDSAEH